ncbi:YncE family protein [Saccharothrix sp. NRRL B-16348]|uniref:YncE family protein n=1 Tax=Saccharothrix sp. NRRL B-16348 TaxID=1415542 RepID=UPI0012F74815|nr:hypothetical protein [Saccharothrix sp. NRRL B-16348]
MPEGSAAAPDDSFAYITNTGSDTVSVTNAKNGKPAAPFAVGKSPDGGPSPPDMVSSDRSPRQQQYGHSHDGCTVGDLVNRREVAAVLHAGSISPVKLKSFLYTNYGLLTVNSQ